MIVTLRRKSRGILSQSRMPWLEYLKTVTKTELPGREERSGAGRQQMTAFQKWLDADAIDRFYEFALPTLSLGLLGRLTGKRKNITNNGRSTAVEYRYRRSGRSNGG